MSSTVFVELRFWLLIALSFVTPAALYAFLYARLSISRVTVLVLGTALIAISGIDVYLLQILGTLARQTSSLADDAVFASEITVALYIVPVCFAGVGINVVSHVLIEHLTRAETRYGAEHPAAAQAFRAPSDRSAD